MSVSDLHDSTLHSLLDHEIRISRRFSLDWPIDGSPSLNRGLTTFGRNLPTLALSKPTVRTRVGLSVNGRLSTLYIPGRQPTQPAAPPLSLWCM